MDLSPRHRSILKALVEEFVSDNKPVGSKTLSEKYDIGVSPATIRSCLAELEEMGFIVARHTSGGRIPTERGYRLYVDSLVTLFELTMREKQRIQEEYLRMQFRLDQVLVATSKVLASLSQSASVVLGPEGSLDTLKHIELIHVNGGEVLMILVMRSGTVLNRNIFFDYHISQETLYQISRYLNDNVKGFDVHEIQSNLIPKMMMQKEGPEGFSQFAPSIARAMGSDSQSVDNLYIDGLKNLYENFKDEEEQLENILHLFDEKQFLKEFFSDYVPMDGVYTIIGKDGNEKLGGVTIITTNYRMGEKRIGSMGIIGPQRMNYNKALPLIEFTSKLVSEMITKLSR